MIKRSVFCAFREKDIDTFDSFWVQITTQFILFINMSFQDKSRSRKMNVKMDDSSKLNYIYY
jgi:hypothetical protein